MHRKHVRWVVLAVFPIVGVVAMLLEGDTRFTEFHSDPIGVRPWAHQWWDRKTRDSGPPPYSAESFFRSHTFQRQGDLMGVTSPGEIQTWPHRLASDQVLRLESIGIALPTPTHSPETHYAVPSHYFDATGTREISRQQLEQWGLRETEVWMEGIWPWVGLLFDSKEQDTEVVSCHLFDKETRHMLTYVQTGASNHRLMELRTWKRTNILASVDYLAGERIWKTMPIAVGGGLQHGKVEVRLLHFMEDLKSNDSPWRSGFTSWNNANIPEGSVERVTGLFIAAYPYANQSELKFRVLDQDGDPVPTTKHVVQNFGYLLHCEADYHRLASIEVGFPQSYLRQLFELPPLPLLPEKNDQLADLLEMEAPYIRLKALQAEEIVEGMAQIQCFFSENGDDALRANVDPSAHFERENVTAREVLRVFDDVTLGGRRYSYDPSIFELRRSQRSPADFWRSVWPF